MTQGREKQVKSKIRFILADQMCLYYFINNLILFNNPLGAVHMKVSSPG